MTRVAAVWQALRSCYRIANALTANTLGLLFKVVVVLYFLFCALVLGLRYIVLPNIDAYKPTIERLATEAIGNQVTVGAIDASWSGLRPRLAFDKLVVHDKAGNAALTLPHVSGTLSWWSFAVGDLRLHRLEIIRPDLDVRRDPDGHLYVAGIYIDAGKRGDSRGADWVLSQREIVIRDGRLRWNDALRKAPELALENVDVVLRNAWRRHRFALKATPPAGFAAPLDVRADFEHPHFVHAISDPAMWKGELYADLRDTDLTVWRSFVDYPLDVRSGKGSVRAWLNFDHARVADLTADLTLAGVSARLGEDLEPLNLQAVSGRISVHEEFNAAVRDGRPTFGQNGHQVALTDFSLQTDDGLYLPRTTISERYVAPRNGRPARTEVQARVLDLQTLASFAERLPIPAEQRRLIADLAPRGVLQDFSAQWTGSYPQLAGYSVKGQFSGLTMRPRAARAGTARTAAAPAQAAMPAIPGFENISGRIDASERGGTLALAATDARLHLPAWYEDPIMAFERLDLQAGWSFPDNKHLLLDVQRLDFAQEGVSAALSGKHRMSLARAPGQSLGIADFSGRVDRLDLQKVGRYLPMQTPDTLRRWLTGALAGGAARDVKLRLKGDLAHFPFNGKSAAERARGEFSVAGKIEQGVLNYAPGEHAPDGASPMWPVIDRIDGSILFDRARMEIQADSARSAGTALSKVKAVIPDLHAQDMVLDVDGEAAGPLQNLVRFTVDSPVGGWIGHFTDETKASGNARLALKLQLPLRHLPDAKVQGGLHFAGNTVTLRNLLPPLANTTGKLEFNEKGFSIGGIRAAFLGGPVSLSGGTQRDGTIMVKAEGSISADGIRKAYATPQFQRTAERITGGTRYATSIRVRNKQPEILVESSMVGIGLDFPAPLRKAAVESMPLRFEITGLPSSDPALARDEIRMALGSAISARYERHKETSKDAGKEAAWRVVRGGIGVNVPAPQPDSGLIANVSMARLDIDAWRRVVGSMATGGPQREARQSDALGIAQYIEPEVLAARANELIIMERKLDNVVVGASHQSDVWQANIDSEQASGYITWIESGYSGGLGRVTARLASLVIPQSAATDVSELLDGKDTATQMPAIDIVAENFELFGKKFGQLELAARNARGPAGREWRINKLGIVNPDGELKASGRWVRKDGENLSTLNYTLDIADAGKLLERFGFANLLRGGKGLMNGEVSWKGMPFSLDIPSLSGNLQLNLASGQFLKADANAAKLLGVLSLQSLPRRLVLDFRDVFSEGFAFDGVAATATINQGVARTDNFKMRGVAATVLIDGSADIAQEAQNLHVVVIPDFNVGAASVVYGLAVNPVVGVGTFLAQLFLREPLTRAFTFEYQVTGPWKDPVVTKLARKQPAPAGEARGNAGPSG
ncbi:MAG TPA: YhdP family protein [Noviherbaspirillum sp.]|uniref:YhdP family protein n=1 Tax=Noviherbaspirillum sp. TaxID=1926288 RepID=UPI002F921662